jgi:DNA polymerase/3'-5' exonuclease PolX
MKLDQAQLIAAELIADLMPACVRIEVGGSVRRHKPDVKDLEIIFIPKLTYRQQTLFDVKPPPPTRATDAVLDRLIADRVIAKDLKTKRWGPLYKRARHPASGAVVEFYAANEDNWGYIYALRTGPAEFNHLLVTKRQFGGAMPRDFYTSGGYLWHKDDTPTRCYTPTEEVFFATLQLPCWPPEERSAEILKAHLRSQYQSHLEFAPVYEGRLKPRY